MEFENDGMLIYGRHEPLDRMRVLGEPMTAPFGKFVPKEVSPNEALRRAMVTVAKATTSKCAEPNLPSSVRVTADCGSFEAVQRRKGKLMNKEVHMFSAALEESSIQPRSLGRAVAAPHLSIQLTSYSRQLDQQEVKSKVKVEFDRERKFLSHGQVSHLTKRILSSLNAVPMEGFNVWFCHSAVGSSFLTWAAAVGLNSFHGSGFSLAANPQTVKDVLTSLAEEVYVAVGNLHETIAGDGLTPRKAKTAAGVAVAMLAKIRSYEAAVGQPLSHLTKCVEELQERLAVANLMAVSA